MTVRIALMAGMALAALAACNRQPSVDLRNAKGTDVANAVARSGGAVAFIRPGKWVSTSTVEQASMPGMSPEMTARMNQAMKTSSTHESCVTEADVKKPRAEFFGAQEGCTYERFTMAGGTLDMKMTCKGEGGGTMSMAMAGTYSADHYAAKMTMTGTGMGPAGQGMTIRTNVDARRVGACG